MSASASLYIGWQPGSSLSLTGYIAMALGLLAAILLGTGVILLIHHDKRQRLIILSSAAGGGSDLPMRLQPALLGRATGTSAK